jgi:hypothetical protein
LIRGRNYLFYWFLFLSLPVLSAGEDDTAVFVIRDIEYRINGRTKPWAIAYAVGLVEGECIEGQGALDEYIMRKTQILKNQRVFEEAKTYIEYSLGETDAEGQIPLTLIVHAEESWNFIVLPEPKYDSNTGFFLTLKAREYNFLGTMEPLKLDFGYEQDEEERQSLHFLLDTNLPFEALGLRWNLDFDNEFKWYFSGEPFFYKNTTGISMELPVKNTALSFGFNEAFILNEENSDKEQEETGVIYYSGWYLSSELYAQWKIPTGLSLGYFGSLDYTPRLSWIWNYRPGGDVGSYRIGPSLNPGHSLSFSRIDWKENFRSGLEVGLENVNSFNLHKLSRDNTVSLSAVGHYPLNEWFGISSRLLGRFYFGDPNLAAGDTLRGQYDKFLNAEYMVSLNLDFPFRLIRFVPSQRLEKPKLHVFDVEVHVSPFLDAALIKGSNDAGENFDFEPGGAVVCAGLEVIVFSLRWRSFYLRLSAGWNLNEALRIGTKPGGVNQEIFIGMGHFY